MPDMVVKIPFIGRDETSNVIRKMRTNIKSFGDTSRSVFRRMRSDALSVRNVMGGILGARAITAGIGVIRNQISTVTDEMIDFDHAATKAAGRYGFDRFSKEFKKIGASARETGANTRFTAGESAKAIDQFAMAGIRLNDALTLVNPTAKLAMAADLELAQSAEIAATALAKFNEPVSNFSKVGDILAFTANKTKTNLAEMFETIQAGGGVINTAGSDVATFSALSRAMGDFKVVGEKAGTSMKTGFLRVLVGGKGGAKARKALGLDEFVKDPKTGKFKDLIDIIEFIEKKYSKMSSADQLKSMRQIFGLNSIEGMNTIMRTGSAKLRQYREEAKNSTGYVDSLSGKMALSYENKLKEIQSAIVEAGFRIVDQYGDEIPGALEFVIQKIRGIDYGAIQEGLERAVSLGKSTISTIKSAMPFIKAAAVIWAGFKINNMFKAFSGTFNHMRESVYLLNRGINPLSTSMRDVNGVFRQMDRTEFAASRNAMRGMNKSASNMKMKFDYVNANGMSGFNRSVDMSKIKLMGVLDTIGMITTGSMAVYTIADAAFKSRDERLEKMSGESDKLNKGLGWDNINKIGSMGEASDYLRKLKNAEYAARTGGGISRANVADSIGAFFSGQESNVEKQKRLVSEYQEKRKAVAAIWDSFADQSYSDLESNSYKSSMSSGRSDSELDKINRVERSFDLNQKVQVETTIKFDGNNVPQGVSAESKTKAPPINRASLGAN